ncbi:MAG: hypothetical protein RL345_1574, partial [Chloroflexota bacterium]
PGGVVALPFPVSSFLVHCSASFFATPPRNRAVSTISASGFGNSQDTPEMAPSFHERFWHRPAHSSLLRCASAHSDSAMSATVTAVFRSSFQTAPGIGPFRGPCGIHAGFHAQSARPARSRGAAHLTATGFAAGPSSANPARRGGRGDERNLKIHIV